MQVEKLNHVQPCRLLAWMEALHVVFLRNGDTLKLVATTCHANGCDDARDELSADMHRHETVTSETGAFEAAVMHVPRL